MSVVGRVEEFPEIWLGSEWRARFLVQTAHPLRFRRRQPHSRLRLAFPPGLSQGWLTRSTDISAIERYTHWSGTLQYL